MWLKIVGGTMAALVAAHFYLLHQINQVADDLVDAASMFANASHRGGYYTWDGNLGIQQAPHRIDDRRHLRAVDGRAGTGHARAGGGCCNWSIHSRAAARACRGLFDRWPTIVVRDAAGDRPACSCACAAFELNINGLLPPGLPHLGFATGVPFETEGCRHPLFRAAATAERPAAALQASRPQLRFRGDRSRPGGRGVRDRRAGRDQLAIRARICDRPATPFPGERWRRRARRRRCAGS